MYEEIVSHKAAYSFDKKLRKKILPSLSRQWEKDIQAIRNLPSQRSYNVYFHDWTGIYDICQDLTGLSFQKESLTEKKHLWTIARKCIVFLWLETFGFNREGTRLHQGRMGKKIDWDKCENIELDASPIVILMELACIGKEIRAEDIPALRLERFGPKARQLTLYKFMDNIARYSSDSVILCLRNLLFTYWLSCLYPGIARKRLLASSLWIRAYDAVYRSSRCMKQSFEALFKYTEGAIEASTEMVRAFLLKDE